jgi:hypothetical protein
MIKDQQLSTEMGQGEVSIWSPSSIFTSVASQV